MNSTASLYNSQFKNTFKSTYNSNYQTGIRPNKKMTNFDYNDQAINSTVKLKIQTLDDDLNKTQNEMESQKRTLNGLQEEKQTLNDTLMLKVKEVKNTLMQELDKVEEELKLHFSHQLSENARLSQEITAIKCEKTVLMNQLIQLQRRILDMEEQVGGDDYIRPEENKPNI
ncbi:MAG: hypothetical protein MJ252_05720 [archaeon]|nr:hypothetical protein [archaeon]